MLPGEWKRGMRKSTQNLGEINALRLVAPDSHVSWISSDCDERPAWLVYTVNELEATDASKRYHKTYPLVLYDSGGISILQSVYLYHTTLLTKPNIGASETRLWKLPGFFRFWYISIPNTGGRVWEQQQNPIPQEEPRIRLWIPPLRLWCITKPAKWKETERIWFLPRLFRANLTWQTFLYTCCKFCQAGFGIRPAFEAGSVVVYRGGRAAFDWYGVE